MESCAICGNKLDTTEPMVIFTSVASNKDYCACSECERQLNRIIDTTNPAEFKKAINYIYSYSKSSQNREVRNYLKEYIDNNASAVVDDPALQDHKNSHPPTGDYYHDIIDEGQSASDGWIFGMKVFSWLIFFATIIAGVIIAIPSFRYGESLLGIALVLISCIVAFALVGTTNVFLNMAQDIKEIRHRLEKK